MTTLLTPARLPLQTSADTDDSITGDERHPGGLVLDYDYLRSLVLGGTRDQHNSKARQRVFCVRLPEIAPSVSRSISIGGYRSLSSSALDRELPAMAATDENAVCETAPSSPPELSYSKSSKSSNSSVRSDSSSDDGSTDKLAHFEDVTFDDGRRSSVEDCNVKPESRPTLRRPARRSGSPDGAMRRDSGRSSGDTRGNNMYPGLKSGVLRDQSLNLPMGRSARNTSPAQTSFTSTFSSQRVLSRSPSPISPGQQSGFATSPQTVSSTTPRASWDAKSTIGAGSQSRRQSWVPGRKTIKELEAEYNDEDEEVPDEAILENVPISPMPGLSGQRILPREKTPSPQRRPSHSSLQSAHGNLHSAKVPKNAKRPSAPTIMPNGQYGSPRSPRHGRPPMPPHSATIASFPPEPFSHKHRSKSWSDDLNEEARQLSQALDEYADRLSSEKRRSGTSGISSAGSSPPRPSLAKARAKTTILELPPVQRGNIMIDPLPVSKEKEAVLTRTRPSWLPPKSQKEEKKHMKEWEQMMARAAEAEKKRASKQKEDLENKEEMQGSIARIWEQHVLPNWSEVVKEPRTRELWWRGVTPRSRSQVWQQAVGNELELSPTSFEAALRRANELEERVAEMAPEERSASKEAAWLDAIDRDVPNVIREQQIYQSGAPLHQALSNVLKAYAMYRSDVGYVYGTHLVAGILCLHLRPAEAFVALANLMNRPLPLAFLVHDQAAMARAYELVLSTLKYKFTKLHSHLTSPATDLQPQDYLDPLFRCLFAHNLPPEHVSRLWDIFVFEGDKVLIRAAVAVLGRLEGKLYGSREEILDLISWCNEKKWDVGSEDDFIKAVRESGKVDAKGEVQNA